MFNTTWKGKAAQALAEATDVTFEAAYDPAVYDQIIAILNTNGDITVHFPDGSTLDFFGYLRSFEPSDNQNGEQPTATVTIVVTNIDDSDGAELGPDYSAPGP